MGDTKIQWTDKSWNPIRARDIKTDERGWFCEHVSEGCRNCYAETMNKNTYFGNGHPYAPSSLPSLELFLDDKMLQQPLHWREPRQVFVCSMTDLFARFVSDSWLDQIFAVMVLAPQHTFQVLTKRPERMLSYMQNLQRVADEHAPKTVNLRYAPSDVLNLRMLAYGGRRGGRFGRAFTAGWPLPNVWLGVSCEDQKTADERIPLLLETPAAVRWISAEPLLGPIDLENIGQYRGVPLTALEENVGHVERRALDWVIVGGESGHGARPFNVDWARLIIKQCKAAGVSCFMKQVGSKPVATDGVGESISTWPLAIKHKKGGDINEWPKDIQVREFPRATATGLTCQTVVGASTGRRLE